MSGMRLRIKGNANLSGVVEISSAKNSVLKLMAASLLSSDPSTILNPPKIFDVIVMAELLQRLGAEVKWNGNRITINPSVDSVEADYDLVSKMRASILVLGPLVARYGKAKVAMPGGCNIGHRKIDIHLSGLQALGAEIRIESGFVIAEARKGLTGTTVNLPIPSVGATENLLMAAVLARGITEIENAAREPEVVDLANFLLRMGARIDGAGTSRIVVEGVDELKGVEYKPIPDRIEAGTFIIAGLITGGKIKIRNVVPDHLSYFIQKLGEAGARIKVRKDEIAVYPSGRLTGVDVATFPYPGFPTDLQPQTMALLATAEGTSVITENIFDNRFLHADELIRMGARIEVNGKHAIVSGTEKLFGVPVRAMDLRGGAALVLAGLAAEGHTDVYDAYHIFRGYENFVQKLLSLGAEIESVVE
jgi:UDP-N-acetylglucosamine 1-carboxyvinyltransferase